MINADDLMRKDKMCKGAVGKADSGRLQAKMVLMKSR